MTETEDKQCIHRQIETFAEAFCTKNLERMMALYTPDFISFDVVPPLQVVGRDAYRNVWKNAFDLFNGPISIDLSDIHITANADVAFSHNLLRLQATGKNGHEVNHWERLTFGFRKVNGEWLIVHEHVSLPVDLASNKAVLDLAP